MQTGITKFNEIIYSIWRSCCVSMIFLFLFYYVFFLAIMLWYQNDFIMSHKPYTKVGGRGGGSSIIPLLLFFIICTKSIHRNATCTLCRKKNEFKQSCIKYIVLIFKWHSFISFVFKMGIDSDSSMDSFTIFGHVYRLCDRYSPIYHAYTFNVRSKSRHVNSVYITSKHHQWKQYLTKVMLKKTKNKCGCLCISYSSKSWLPNSISLLDPIVNACINALYFMFQQLCKGGQILISFIKLLPKNSRNDTFPKVFILI